MSFIKDFFNEFVLMFKPYYKYIRFFIVFFLFFTSSIFQLIPISILKLDINNISDNIQSYLTLFSISFTLLIVCIFYFKELKKAIKNLLNYKKNRINSKFNKAFKYWLIGLIIMIVSNILVKFLGAGDASNDVRVINNLKSDPLIYGSITLFLTPILEELVFRLSFKDIFKYKWLFILLSGIIFGSIHVLSSLTDIYQLLYLIPYCSLGLAFSFMYYDTDNIFIPISFHILHNILVTISTFLLAGGILW